MPTVSVIIPNYNHAPYLKERIDSVLNQTFQDFGVIILDDKSTDNSREIIEQYRNHPKISHIIYNDVNSGSTFKQWNKGIQMAKGEWIWIAESDDVAEPTFLSALLSGIDNDGIVLAYCQSNKINSESIVTGNWLDQTKNHKRSFNVSFTANGEDFIKEDLLQQNVIPNASAVIFRKSIFYKVGFADEDIRYNSDWLLWLKIVACGQIVFVSDPLNQFRYHENSVIAKSGSENKIPFKRKYDILMMERYLDFLKSNSNQYLISPVKASLFVFSKTEFEFLYQRKFRKESFFYFKKLMSYSSHKIQSLLSVANFIRYY